MTRQEKKPEAVWRAGQVVAKPLVCFLGMTLVYSMFGGSKSRLVEQVILSAILMLSSGYAGFLCQRQFDGNPFAAGGICGTVVLLLQWIITMLCGAGTPALAAMALGGAKVLPSAIAGSLMARKKVSRRRRR